MNILQVNYYDNLGGAARIAWLLHQGYRRLGHHSWMTTGYKISSDPFVKLIPPALPVQRMARPFFHLAEFADKHQWRIGRKNIGGVLRRIADPGRYIQRNKGFEDFDFPNSRLITSLIDESPEIVHLHNLHLNYFDLTYLPELSNRYPTVMTLHDMWPLTGHCAHAMNCQRWVSGCGECPQLEVYPAMSHDQTAFNWLRKKEIYAKSKIYLTGPSNWMVQTAKNSILSPAIIKSKVIPNGIDLEIFRSGDKMQARDSLGLPLHAFILLFVSAGGIQFSSFKDYSTIQNAIKLVSQNNTDQKIVFIALGDKKFVEKTGNIEILHLPHVDSAEILANYYRAVDVYIHAAKAESFGLVIAEAQACGTPVIATAVGGIPDTIKDGETGFLTHAEDANEMAEKISLLASDKQLLCSMGEKAAQFAKNAFGVEKMVNNYLSFYQEILDDRNK